MGEQRKTTDTSKLTDEQRDALARARTAQLKVKRATSAQRGAIAARDDLIRQALTQGVGATLIAKTLEINGAMVWKIRKGLTTQEVERRREAGGDT